jgi:hypothetical protein
MRVTDSRLLWLATLLLSLASFPGCSTKKLVKQEQLALLTAQYDYMQGTDSTLTSTPNPETASSMSVFVSQDTLNAVLKGADNYSAAIPGIDGAVFHLRSMRMQFGDGFPALTIDSEADKASIHASLQLQVYAVIEPSISNGEIHFAVAVKKVVPIAHWCIFQFRLGGFVRDLIQLKLEEYAKLMPDMYLPLQQVFSTNGAAQEQPLNVTTSSGRVDGAVSIPAYSATAKLQVTNVLFLRDGIHIYLKATQS